MIQIGARACREFETLVKAQRARPALERADQYGPCPAARVQENISMPHTCTHKTPPINE